jgi:hypothetical protein
MRPIRLIYIALIGIMPFMGFGQDCNILSKANDIDPDQLCSPVEVVTWVVSYVGVNNAGTQVEIHFDWLQVLLQLQATIPIPRKETSAITILKPPWL